MSEIDKHLDRAEKFLQKGRNVSALREYLEILQENPAHEGAAQAAVDVYQTLGYLGEAANLLDRIFDRQLATGQSASAAATYRKLQKLTTPTPERSLAAARILEKNSRDEALEAYRAALRGFTAMARLADALLALEGIVAIEPSVDDLRKMGELASERRDSEKAAAAYLQAGDLSLQDPARAADTLDLYEHAHRLIPTDVRAAVAYARALLAGSTAGYTEKAIAVLQRLVHGPQATPESRETYGQALLAAGRYREAEPFVWESFERNPSQPEAVVRLIGQMLDSDQAQAAVALARRLEQEERRAGRLREHATAMSDLAAKYPPDTDFLEYLVELFNAANKEAEYGHTLLQLFELYYAAGNFLQAGDCLDRAAEVDPYMAGHKKRLEMLRGKIDERRLRSIADRISGVVTTEGGAGKKQTRAASLAELSDDESTVLEDLILQAEIFLQYELQSRALEKLQRIHKLFPEEHTRNEKLRNLYVSAGVDMRPVADAPAPPDQATEAFTATEQAAVDDIARITEITRNIHRQDNAKSTLFTAVNEAGRHWNASRCVAVLCTPGKPPSIALEYCAPGTEPSDVHAIVKLMALLQPLVLAHGALAVSEDGTAPFLMPLKQFAAGMGINSLLVMPLVEGEEHIGMLLLAQCGAGRTWRPSDTVVLKTVAEQTVLALANVRLRSLVTNLAVKEEKTGLLKRSSYLDILVSEVRRAVEQKSSITLVLVNFGKAAELVREAGEPAVEAVMQQIGQVVCSQIRQNDLAVRYDLTTVALVLSGTDEKSALFTIDKLRNVISNLRLAGRTPSLTAGIAEAVMRAEFDPVDIVTEVINRVDEALHVAFSQGGSRVHALAATSYNPASA
jgi:diguanylate cyclase (GGDEF)-like protein